MKVAKHLQYSGTSEVYMKQFIDTLNNNYLQWNRDSGHKHEV